MRKGRGQGSIFWNPDLFPSSGLHKTGTARTASVRQTACGWTKQDLNEQIIRYILKRATIFCLSFALLVILSNEYLASYTELLVAV